MAATQYSTGVNSEGGTGELSSTPCPAAKGPSEWITLRAATVPAPGVMADVRDKGCWAEADLDSPRRNSVTLTAVTASGTPTPGSSPPYAQLLDI